MHHRFPADSHKKREPADSLRVYQAVGFAAFRSLPLVAQSSVPLRHLSQSPSLRESKQASKQAMLLQNPRATIDGSSETTTESSSVRRDPRLRPRDAYTPSISFPPRRIASHVLLQQTHRKPTLARSSRPNTLPHRRGNRAHISP